MPACPLAVEEMLTATTIEGRQMTDESQQDHCATRRCVLLGAGVLGAAGILSACSTAAVPYDANQAGQAPAPAGMPTTATMAPSPAGSGAMSSGSMSSP